MSTATPRFTKLFEDDFAVFHIQTGVELRGGRERTRQNLHEDGRHGELAPAASTFLAGRDRKTSRSVMSALSYCVTVGTVAQAWAMLSAVILRTLLMGSPANGTKPGRVG